MKLRNSLLAISFSLASSTAIGADLGELVGEDSVRDLPLAGLGGEPAVRLDEAPCVPRSGQ